MFLAEDRKHPYLRSRVDRWDATVVVTACGGTGYSFCRNTRIRRQSYKRRWLLLACNSCLVLYHSSSVDPNVRRLDANEMYVDSSAWRWQQDYLHASCTEYNLMSNPFLSTANSELELQTFVSGTLHWISLACSMITSSLLGNCKTTSVVLIISKSSLYTC